MKNLSCLFCLLCFSFMFSCTSISSDEGTDSSKQTDVTTENQPSPKVGSTWEDYWPRFQVAVASGDKMEVIKLTKLGNHITEASFHDYFDVYFGDEMKTIIANTKAQDVPKIEDGVEFPEGRTIAYEEIDEDEEGNEIGSALILYFGKEEGAFRLLMFFAAG